ncbi:hypothetical protein FACS1894199_09220 [Bacteroidia bacterium]|nr:hypothetical protein FACS1894199_09220 [Bacteroidia bacterium]
MARRIECTPIMEGEDAKRFMKNLVETLTHTYSPSELAAKKEELRVMEENYQKIVEASHGVFY